MGQTVTVTRANFDDEEPELARQAGVSGIPFVVLYRDGQRGAEAIGAQPKAALERSLGLTT